MPERLGERGAPDPGSRLGQVPESLMRLQTRILDGDRLRNILSERFCVRAHIVCAGSSQTRHDAKCFQVFGDPFAEFTCGFACEGQTEYFVRMHQSVSNQPDNAGCHHCSFPCAGPSDDHIRFEWRSSNGNLFFRQFEPPDFVQLFDL